MAGVVGMVACGGGGSASTYRRGASPVAQGELVPPPRGGAGAVVVAESEPSDVQDALMFDDPAGTEETPAPRRMVITVEPASAYGADRVQAELDAGPTRRTGRRASRRGAR